MGPSEISFILLAIPALFGAIGVVFFKEPVHAALALVLNFFVLALFFFQLGAQFLGITQIMVYAGAIMVLFLFVIMILKDEQKKEVKREARTRGIYVGAALSAFAIFGILAAFIVRSPASSMLPNVSADFGKPQPIGYTLFSQYIYPFEVASILLLIGIVGSILLAKRRLK